MLTRVLRDLFLPGASRGEPYVAFIADVAAPARVMPDTVIYSTQAGFRLRTMMAARGVATQMPAWLIPPALAGARGGLKTLGEPQAIFVSKFLIGRMVANRRVFDRILERLAESAVPAVADVTDDFRLVPVKVDDHGAYLYEWQRALGERCHFVCTTEALRETVGPIAKRGTSLIEDPYEWNELGIWRAPSADPIRICWFGNTASETLPPVERTLNDILSAFPERRFVIEIVTAVRWNLIDDMIKRLSGCARDASFIRTNWSLDATRTALERSDFAILPHNTSSDWVRGKSHNRLVAAIAAGRLALASPIPAYQELREGAWISEDLVAGLAWALANPHAAGEKVRRGQLLVEPRFSPAAVQEKWRAVFMSLLSGQPTARAAHG